MNDHSNKQSSAPQLSTMRMFLFGALAFVWFAEMVQWGFLASSGGWQNIWTFFPPEAPQLATALSITHAIRAAATSCFCSTACRLAVLCRIFIQSRTQKTTGSIHIKKGVDHEQHDRRSDCSRRCLSPAYTLP